MKLKKSQLLVVLFIGLAVLIVGASVLLNHNFNIIGQFDDGGIPHDVYVVGDYAYVVDYSDGLEIIDISDPTSPSKVGQFDDDRTSHDVYVMGDFAYVAGGSDGLEIIDISDPTSPSKVGQFDDGGTTHDVFVVGDYAYVAGGSDGLKIIDISDPTTSLEVGQIYDGGRIFNVYVMGDYAYVRSAFDVSSGLEIIDISDPTSPSKVGQYHGGIFLYSQGFYVSGSYAYMVNAINVLEIIDISNPTNPRKVGQLADCMGSNDIYVSGSYVYMAAGSNGIKIIDISDPTSPVEVGQDGYGEFAESVCGFGDILYVIDLMDGLEIIDPWGQKEKISNIILWSILSILILLTLVDLGYIFKNALPLNKESLSLTETNIKKEFIEVEVKKMSIESNEEKKRVKGFFMGFLITYLPLAIFNLVFSLVDGSGYGIFHYFASLLVIGILIIVSVKFLKKKSPYISMGMIASIFGSLFLRIKKYEDLLVDPYTDHPKKKNSHFIIGFLLSIGLMIINIPVILMGFLYIFMNFYFPIVVISIIVSNVFIGVVRFFFKENLRYISKGMIFSIPWVLPIIIIIVFLIWYLPVII